jgi:hypothetical protein
LVRHGAVWGKRQVPEAAHRVSYAFVAALRGTTVCRVLESVSVNACAPTVFL